MQALASDEAGQTVCGEEEGRAKETRTRAFWSGDRWEIVGGDFGDDEG